MRFGPACIAIVAILLTGPAQADPIEWLRQTNPEIAGYCCSHEDCSPIKPGQLAWSPLGGADGSYTLRDPSGGFYRGSIKTYGKHDLIMPKSLGARIWACVLNGRFRCLLRGRSGQ